MLLSVVIYMGLSVVAVFLCRTVSVLSVCVRVCGFVVCFLVRVSIRLLRCKLLFFAVKSVSLLVYVPCVCL